MTGADLQNVARGLTRIKAFKDGPRTLAEHGVIDRSLAHPLWRNFSTDPIGFILRMDADRAEKLAELIQGLNNETSS